MRHSKASRLGVPQTHAVLLPCPLLGSTREKSPPPTTPAVPRPAHRRRSGGLCGTTPPAGTLLSSAAPSADGQRARRGPKVRASSAGSLAPSTAAAPRPRGAAALLGRSLNLAAYNKPREDLLRFSVEVGTR